MGGRWVPNEVLPNVPVSHVCRVVRSPEEQTAEAANWARLGLSGAERVLYVGRARQRDNVLRQMDENGDDWRQAANGGQLLVVHPDDLHQGAENHLNGRLPELKVLLEESLDQGYVGLRLADDVSATLSELPEQEALLDYEQRLDELCTTNGLSAMCFYDRRRFGAGVSRWVQAHQCLADHAVRALAAPGRLTISGEMDFSNVGLVASTLQKATPPVGDLIVDLRGLSFIDVRGVEELIDLARRIAPVGRVKVVDPPATMRRILEVAGWGAELDIVDELEPEI
jgi:anti-anti-sigma factor